MKYLVIQKGFAVFGHGSTPEQAVRDMKQWINKDDPMQQWDADDFPTCYETANIGEFVLVPATNQLLEQYGGEA